MDDVRATPAGIVDDSLQLVTEVLDVVATWRRTAAQWSRISTAVDRLAAALVDADPTTVEEAVERLRQLGPVRRLEAGQAIPNQLRHRIDTLRAGCATEVVADRAS